MAKKKRKKATKKNPARKAPRRRARRRNPARKAFLAPRRRRRSHRRVRRAMRANPFQPKKKRHGRRRSYRRNPAGVPYMAIGKAIGGAIVGFAAVFAVTQGIASRQKSPETPQWNTMVRRLSAAGGVAAGAFAAMRGHQEIGVGVAAGAALAGVGLEIATLAASFASTPGPKQAMSGYEQIGGYQQISGYQQIGAVEANLGAVEANLGAIEANLGGLDVSVPPWMRSSPVG